jgi:glycosyltransferase involved in cell wall biosynthesis
VTVSVVIPSYNRPVATGRAVRSALAQSAPPHEIVVVDDASTPPLARGDLACDDPRLRIVRRDANGGAAAARQTGVDAATGELVAFLDSDDVWLPGKLAAQLACYEDSVRRTPQARDLIAVACGWETRPESGAPAQRRIPLASAHVVDFASGCWFSPGSTVLVPRAAFAVVGPFDGRLRRLEDLDWFLRFALAGGRLEVAPVVGAHISIGRRSTREAVEDAAGAIAERASRQAPAAVSRQVLRALSAYIDVERAACARNEGRYLAMAAWLLRSLLARPRMSVPLRRWWRELAPGSSN